jgi:hypothetical protein
LNRTVTRNSGLSFETVIDQFRDTLKVEKINRFRFIPTPYPKAKQRTKESIFDKSHSEIAALVLSDWHLSEHIRPEESNGVNKFNSIILSNRVYAIIDKFKRIVRGHQAMYNVEKIWVQVLGDMINGSIHPELVLTNDLLDVPAAILAARLLIMAILELRVLGLPIEIDCTVGNHPRLLAKMPAKRQAHLSYDWMIYTMVEQYFERDPKVTVRVHTGQFALVQQYTHRYVLEHGYGAQTENLPERVRKMFDNPIYRKATKFEGNSLDCVSIGDKHQAKAGPGYMVNGCLSGSNEYGMSLRLEPIGAIQQMFGISKSRYRTFHYELDVTDVLSEKVDNCMSDYTTGFMAEHGR